MLDVVTDNARTDFAFARRSRICWKPELRDDRRVVRWKSVRILIDDARLFLGKSDYPKIEEVEAMVRRKYPHWVFEVKDDIIRAHA